VDNETDRLARQVAEAADAWLRDPLDTQIYHRLVRATLDWRVAASGVAPAADSDGAHDDGPDDDAPDDDAATDDLDPVPAERQPQRLDMLLGPLADELRARGERPT
jgi:hypothetical protein